MKLNNIFYVLAISVITLTSCDIAKVELSPSIINLIDDEYETKENESVNLNVLDNDEVKGENITIEISTPENGLIVLNKENLSFTYTPNKSFKGTENLIYSVCNDNGCEEANVLINVKSKRNIPIDNSCNFTVQVINDFVSVKENVIFDVDLISNDIFCKSKVDLNTFSVYESIINGKIISSSNGILRIIMDKGFNRDELKYTICTQSGDCDKGKLNIYNSDDNPIIK